MTAFAFRTSLLPAALLAALLWTAPALAADADAAHDQSPVVINGDSSNTVDMAVTPEGATYDEEHAPGVSPKIEHAEDKLTAAEGEDHSSEAGFPQLNVHTYSSQVFWLFISFGLLYALMSRAALPRVTEVLDMRQTQINGNLDRAAQLNEEAASTRKAFNAALAEAQDAARSAITAVEQKAAELATQDSAAFADRARERLAGVEKNIAKAKTDALVSLTDIAAEVAADMVNKVGHVQVGKAEARQVVQSLMNKAA